MAFHVGDHFLMGWGPEVCYNEAVQVFHVQNNGIFDQGVAPATSSYTFTDTKDCKISKWQWPVFDITVPTVILHHTAPHIHLKYNVRAPK